VSVLDKAIQKGVLHENTASRYKSRLSARPERTEVGAVTGAGKVTRLMANSVADFS